MNDEIRSALYDKYIKPTEKKKESYVGIEIELPIVKLKKEATSHNDQGDHGLILKSEKMTAAHETSTSPILSNARRILFSLRAYLS